MIEGAVFADDDDHVLDGRLGIVVAAFVLASHRVGQRSLGGDERKQRCCHQSAIAQTPITRCSEKRRSFYSRSNV
jgi:hypothetical protein